MRPALKPTVLSKGVLGLFLASTLFAASLAEGSHVVSLRAVNETAHRWATHQRTLSDLACSPTALYHSLLFGNPEFKSLVEKLPGQTATEKLRHFFETYFLEKTSDDPDTNGRPRYHSSIGGVLPEDLLATFREVIGDSEAKISREILLDRKTGNLSSRLVRLVQMSLAQGVPPIMSLKVHVAKSKKQKRRKFEWKHSGGHSVVVLGVDHSSEDTVLLHVFDPWDGLVKPLYVWKETSHHFAALKWNFNRGYWLKRDNPYFLASIQTGGLESPKWHQRRILFAYDLIYAR